jgi:hypothetical protein
MATATSNAVNGLIDSMAATLKAQIDSSVTALKAQVAQLTFNPDPIVVVPVVKAPSITYSTQAPFTVGKPVSAFSPVNGGDAAIYTATLPAGLSIATSTGTISGTPIAAKAATTYTVVASNLGGSSTATLVLTVNAPVIVTPPADPAQPGGKSSAPLSYSGLNNQTITGLSFDGGGKAVDLLRLSNCTNIHVTLCRFSNTNGNSITLSNCTNVTIDYNFFTMVNFGVHAEACIGTQVNHNQGLNLWAPVLYNKNFAHWIQFHNCNSANQSISNNILESITGVAVHPHDSISIDACSGTSASPIKINNNWLRGGQQTAFPNSGDTGGGIMAPDESGNYYEIKNNIFVNPGCSAFQANGSGSNIVFDNNLIFNNVPTSVAANGITVLGSHSNMTISNNRVWWLNKLNHAVAQSDGETSYYFGGSGTGAGVTLSNNKWLDTTLNASILPATIITYK